MNEFSQQFLGSHPIGFYVAGLIFSLLGGLLYKYHAWQKHKKECEVKGHDHAFSLKYWIRDNWQDMIISLIVSFLCVRFIDLVIHWLNPKIQAAVGFSLPETEDQIAYFLIVAMVTQWAIHKYYRK